MSIPQQGGGPIERCEQLAEYMATGEKPRAEWRIGTEHEKFGYLSDSLTPLPYDGPRSIRAILLEKQARFGWQPVYEQDALIGLTRDGANISLEPGGQLELSGAPHTDMHAIAAELDSHLRECAEVVEGMGVGFSGIGAAPIWSHAQMPRMPKGRYRLMTDYMGKVGTHGTQMMYRTCTVQVNLDFASEADMVKKFRVSLALQPIATALFADSPFTDGKPNGYLSYRSHIWTDTDADRTGMLDFVFEPGFGFERYVDYLLDVPMYFVYRAGLYIDAAGQSFRDFMAGRLPALSGELPSLKDFGDHLTTAFPEVRLKRYLEMRGADGGPWNRLCALPAFWVGLLDDDAALDAAWDLVKDFSNAERHALRDGVPRQGFKLPFRDRSLRELALEALKISQSGLQRRARRNPNGADESVFLEPLIELALANETPAERKLALYHGAWDESVDPIFREFAY
jgi:glutamate--cysteine ligase